jgi:hypothetical protein
VNQSRRDFVKQGLGAVAALAAFPALIKALLPSVAQAQAKPKFVVPGQGMAASVGYVENKAKVEKALQIERNGVKFADQKCATCVLFNKDAGGDYGKCALFPTEVVKPTSWCKSWSKKT